MDLSDALDGELTVARQDEVDTHLAQCPRCRAAQAGLQRTVRLLRILGQRRREPALPPLFAVPYSG
jgi:anti-sigma factor RsiW